MRDFWVAQAPRYQGPVLVVWGRQDAVLPMTSAADAREVMPQAQIQLIDQCGHLPMIERPDRVPRGASAVPRQRRSRRRGVRETGTIKDGVKTRSRPSITTPRAKLTLSAEQIIADYRLAVRSRAASELGRREVLAGRAPFGIFGDGKEVAQLAMAHVMRPGDWRSGYYRDQTVMMAVGTTTLEQYFAQLYADADVLRDPFSGGRQMSNHYATRIVDEQGHWRDS